MSIPSTFFQENALYIRFLCGHKYTYLLVTIREFKAAVTSEHVPWGKIAKTALYIILCSYTYMCTHH